VFYCQAEQHVVCCTCNCKHLVASMTFIIVSGSICFTCVDLCSCIFVQCFTRILQLSGNADTFSFTAYRRNFHWSIFLIFAPLLCRKASSRLHQLLCLCQCCHVGCTQCCYSYSCCVLCTVDLMANLLSF